MSPNTSGSSSERAKLGTGQPIDLTKLHAEMDEDRMDRLIRTTHHGKKTQMQTQPKAEPPR